MSIVSEFKNDLRAAKSMRLPWWGVVIGIICSTLSAWLFGKSGRLDLDLPTLNSIAVVGFFIALKWKLRRHLWFWCFIAVVALLHIPLILFIPWTTKWVAATAIACIDSADFCLMLWGVSILRQRLTDATPTRE